MTAPYPFPTKADARDWARKAHQAMPATARLEASHLIVGHLKRWHAAQDGGGRIFLFAALPHEPNLLSLVDQTRVAALPAVKDRHTMEYRTYRQGDALTRQAWGLREPAADAAVVTPGKDDVVLIPVVAMTADGHRLGHGAGYYDRYIASLSETPKLVLVGYSDFLWPAGAWPAADHDFIAHAVCSERGVTPV